MKKKKRNILLISLVILILLGVTAGGTIYYYIFSHPFKIQKVTYLYLDRDDTIDSVFHKIENVGHASDMQGVKWVSDYYKYKQIRTGRYPIYPDDNALSLIRRISRGFQEAINITFNNIRTREQLAQRIGNQLMIDSIDIAEMLFDRSYQERMEYEDETIISMFIPNTYQVYWDISAENFLSRMQKEHDKFWNEERMNKAKSIGLSPLQVSTLASIVEEETNDNEEKPIVAGLYINRLKKGMLLQADPTVKFALGDFARKRIYNQDLTIDSPYNTYKYIGLPPGPIRIPSIKGIDSVLNYSKHNYIYMCAKEDLSGKHNFASTLAQHQANARKYWEALNKRRIF